MKRIRFLALLMALALVLTGCGEVMQEQTVTGVYTDPAAGADTSNDADLPSAPVPDDAQPSEEQQTTEDVQAPGDAQTPEENGTEEDQQTPGDTQAGEDTPAEDGTQTAEDAQAPEDGESWAPEYGGYYYDVKNVVLYLEAYGELPPNYITKNEARDLGWSGGSVEDYLEGAAIGGDRFGNYEGLLPEAKGRTWTECDIDTLGYGSRGARRLVFSGDGLYYYTSDHYESFKEVTVENGEVSW